MRLFTLVISTLFYCLVALITLGKISENYLHSPDCKGCREDR